MSRVVKLAKCLRQVFDNANGILYYPNDIAEELNLDSDIALCFELLPADRKYARDAEQKRIAERQAEGEEMRKEGFSNVYEFRRYKEQLEQETTEEGLPDAPEDRPYSCAVCGKAFETLQKLQGHKGVHTRAAASL